MLLWCQSNMCCHGRGRHTNVFGRQEDLLQVEGLVLCVLRALVLLLLGLLLVAEARHFNVLFFFLEQHHAVGRR
jgi:hypothetical protein